MKNTLRALLCASLLVPVAACAAPSKAKTAKTKTAKTAKRAMVMCTVMKHEVPRAEAQTATYKGKTYYFCCNSCVSSFKANPAKYAKSAPAGSFAPAPKNKPAKSTSA